KTTRRFPPQLDPIPTEISSVPMFHRRWLSPIHLNCSLGRSENSNPFTTFRHLSGTFNLSRNIRAHTLYTGDMGAIFTENNEPTWFHHTLPYATQWLLPVISSKGYALFQSQAQSQSTFTFPTATLVTP
ncbi:197_t:CDS:1, partial [Paraglomus occultum]